MDCILYNQLGLLLDFAFDSFEGLRRSSAQSAASTTGPASTCIKCTGPASNCAWLSSSIFLDYLTHEEAQEIVQQFESISQDDCQLVFWTGVPRERAQQWADARGMSTLTTMMGPLMETSNARCHRNSKSPTSWSKYVKGASIMFSLYASRSGMATVLTIPPSLQPFDLRPGCTFFSLEEPILKGKLGDLHDVTINFVHPMVEGAEDFVYEVWPTDSTKKWTERFGDGVTIFKHWGRRMARTKRAALGPVKKQKPARNRAEAKDSNQMRKVKKENNATKMQNAQNVLQVRKAMNVAEAEKARRLKQAKKAVNILKMENAKKLKDAKTAKIAAKAEKARR